MPILFASSNPGKVREMEPIFQELGLELLTLDQLPQPFSTPEETGSTFEENARIKAQSYAAQAGLDCIAEDSGLVVDALGGAPGVDSAYYAGHHPSRVERDRANNARLLREMRDVEPERRTARFVCAICLATPGGALVAEARGAYEGRIAFEEAGSGGFGYDPLLFIPELGRTSAELTLEEKNARSHRGAAARALVQKLSQISWNLR